MIISRAEFWNGLIAQINAERESCAAHLINGSAQTFEDYRERCGYLKGLAAVAVWINEAIEKDKG